MRKQKTAIKKLYQFTKEINKTKDKYAKVLTWKEFQNKHFSKEDYDEKDSEYDFIEMLVKLRKEKDNTFN